MQGEVCIPPGKGLLGSGTLILPILIVSLATWANSKQLPSAFGQYTWKALQNFWLPNTAATSCSIYFTYARPLMLSLHHTSYCGYFAPSLPFLSSSKDMDFGSPLTHTHSSRTGTHTPFQARPYLICSWEESTLADLSGERPHPTLSPSPNSGLRPFVTKRQTLKFPLSCRNLF